MRRRCFARRDDRRAAARDRRARRPHRSRARSSPARRVARTPPPPAPVRACGSASGKHAEPPGLAPRARRRGLEADPVLLGVQAHVDDLGQVEGQLGVLGLQLVPAARVAAAVQRLAELLVGGLEHPYREYLPAREADVDPRRLGCRVLGHQRAGSTSSVSTPPVASGWRKATRLPRIPVCGSSSISRRPADLTHSSAESMSVVWYATWWRPGPLRSRNLPTPLPGESGRSSSTCPSPISSSSASTSKAATISRCCSRIPKRSR